MNSTLLIISLSTIFLLAVLVVIVFAIFFRRILLQLRDRKNLERHKAIERDVLHALNEKNDTLSVEVAKKYKTYPKILIKVLIAYMETFLGQERHHLTLIFQTGPKTKLHKEIFSKFLIKRLRAVAPFVLFSTPEDLPVIIRLLNDKPAISLAAINALSRFPHPHLIPAVFQALKNEQNPNLRAYLNVLYKLGGQVEELTDQFLEKPLSTAKLCLLIDLVGILPLPRLYHHIIGFADHKNTEIRVRTARTLGNMVFAIDEIRGPLIKLVSDTKWEVRAQAIKSVEHLKINTAVDAIADNLYSEHWHCRLNAGYALSNLGEWGMLRLQEIASKKNDHNASAVASMVLEETALLHSQ